MTHTANHSVPEPGRFSRSLAAVWAFLQSLEATTFDYSLDRIERLEREVGQLKEELRQSRHSETVGAHDTGVSTLEHRPGR